jgi:hypothetical protein
MRTSPNVLLMNISRSRRLVLVCQAICLIGISNFFVFVAVASYLGGDALNGRVDGEHYYLFGVRSEYGHKVYTEVSQAVFTYSKWHAYSVLMTWPLVILAIFALNRAGRID